MTRVKHIIFHLQKDPVLAKALKHITLSEIVPRTDYFSDLCDAIISQQLSTKAGATIFGRFKKLFPNEIITPEKTLRLKDQQIRDVGASWSKVTYLKNLAQFATTFDLKDFNGMSDDEVTINLMKIKGVGRWTAEMFLIFTLGREDIFSAGDAGLQRAITKLYGKRNMKHIIEQWSPYKSYACRILWQSLDI